VKVPRAQTHRTTQRASWWWIGRALWIGGCQVIIRTCPWTIVDNVRGEYHDAFCMLKTYLADYDKE